MSSPKVVCVIMGGGRGTRLYPLTASRCKPAVPLAGKYRLIDIPISNCLNSGFNSICVLTQFNTASLHSHIQRTYKFDAFGKGYVDILAAEQNMEGEAWYQGTADAVRHNLQHFNLKDNDHVLILSGDQLFRMDFRPMIMQHITEKADVTIAAKAMPKAEVSALGVMRVRDNSSEITEFVEKPKDPAVIDSLVIHGKLRDNLSDKSDAEYCLASMGIYVFTGKFLNEALDNDMKDFGKEVIPSLLGKKKLIAHVFDAYWEDIGTVRAFWETNLALTDPIPPFDFYDEVAPIYTHDRLLPAAKLNGCTIERVVMAEGAIVTNAKLTRCVVGVRAVIDTGAELENVVHMGADTFESLEEIAEAKKKGVPMIGVGKNSVVKNAIIDKNARIGENCRLSPKGVADGWETPELCVRGGVLVVKKNSIIPAGTVIGDE
ncbi:MAG: glucose-1-phosphate adenylyltransferase [Opitutae bacterium]|nr:glucose-1-phosphate adenylyltransferase [Opitutae bacterium]